MKSGYRHDVSSESSANNISKLSIEFIICLKTRIKVLKIFDFWFSLKHEIVINENK